LIRQLDYPTLTLLAKRYYNFDHSRDQILVRLRVPAVAIAAYFANKGNNEKLDTLMRLRSSRRYPSKSFVH